MVTTGEYWLVIEEMRPKFPAAKPIEKPLKRKNAYIQTYCMYARIDLTFCIINNKMKMK